MVASAISPLRETPEERAEFDRLVREAKAALDTAAIDHDQAVQLRDLVDSLAALRAALSLGPVARPVIDLMEALMGRIHSAPAQQDPFAAIERDLDARIERMQGADARARAQAAFEASPEALGAAAVAAARRRG